MPHEQIEDSYIDPMADFVTIKVNKNEHERLKGATPCTFPDCMSARAVRAAGEEYQRGYAEGLEKAAKIADHLRCRDVALDIRVVAPMVEFCEWTYDDNEHAPKWDTSCGAAWCFIEGGPGENRVKFCHYCGKTIKVV